MKARLHATLDRLLTRVAYGTDISAHPVSVTPDGRWRHGELTGTASPRPESPKLLGAAARAADRIRRAEQIRDRISDLCDDHELMSLELDDVVGLLVLSTPRLITCRGTPTSSPWCWPGATPLKG